MTKGASERLHLLKAALDSHLPLATNDRKLQEAAEANNLVVLTP